MKASPEKLLMLHFPLFDLFLVILLLALSSHQDLIILKFYPYI